MRPLGTDTDGALGLERQNGGGSRNMTRSKPFLDFVRFARLISYPDACSLLKGLRRFGYEIIARLHSVRSRAGSVPRDFKAILVKQLHRPKENKKKRLGASLGSGGSFLIILINPKWRRAGNLKS